MGRSLQQQKTFPLLQIGCQQNTHQFGRTAARDGSIPWKLPDVVVPTRAAMDSLSISNGNFTLDLFKKLDQSFQGQNLFFSSWSISSALSMICLGARDKTATEMARVLHFSAKETESSPSSQDLNQGEGIHSEFQKLLEEINQPKRTYLLKIANRLYGEKIYPFLSEYLQHVKKYYHAEPQAVDFLRAAEEVRDQINAWVEKETNNKITNLLPQDAVDSRTILVLVNAIYFKGKWKTRFQKRNTSVMPFRLSKTKSKPVQMMFLKNKFRIFFIETLMVTILELPYVNDELSMFILLPEDITDDTTGLELLEKELTYERLSTWTSAEMMDQMEVEVHLPRMRLQENYDLRSTLSSMGMTDVFSQSRANLTGMSKENNLFLSGVYHKSFVEVNEEGTEATAASGAVVVVRSAQLPISFKGDHPFLFFIRHNASKSILFFGRFCSP